MDNNFEIMKAMNYGFDNPEFRNRVNPDEMGVMVAAQNELDEETLEQIISYASMSREKKAYAMALEQLRNTQTMSVGVERTRTM